MADSDPPKTDSSSTPERPAPDFDLDFDLGDLDFDNDPVDAALSPIPSKATTDPLAEDLDALVAGSDKSPPSASAAPDTETEEDENDTAEEDEAELGKEPDTPPAIESEQGDADSPEEGAIESDGEPETEEEMDVPPGEEEQIEPPEVEIDEGEEEIDIGGDEEEERPPEPDAPAVEPDDAKPAPPTGATPLPADDGLDVMLDDGEIPDIEIDFDDETDQPDDAATEIEQLADAEPGDPEPEHAKPRHVPVGGAGALLDDDIANSDNDIAPLELQSRPDVSSVDERDDDKQDDDAAPARDADPPGEPEAKDSDKDGKPKGGLHLPNFKPLELAGIAAVFILCLGALIMLSNTVSGTLQIARDSAREVSESVPSKVEGERIKLAGIECYWRDRLDDDRANKSSTILPSIKIASGSGDGRLQILFRDPEGKIRGDAHTFTLSGDGFDPGGASVLVLGTEGMSNEVQFAAYRSADANSENDRWTAVIREGTDSIHWVDLVEFEIPPERRTGDE